MFALTSGSKPHLLHEFFFPCSFSLFQLFMVYFFSTFCLLLTSLFPSPVSQMSLMSVLHALSSSLLHITYDTYRLYCMIILSTSFEVTTYIFCSSQRPQIPQGWIQHIVRTLKIFERLTSASSPYKSNSYQTGRTLSGRGKHRHPWTSQTNYFAQLSVAFIKQFDWNQQLPQYMLLN